MKKIKRFNVRVNGQEFEVEVQEVIGEQSKKKASIVNYPKHTVRKGTGNVTAPMPGVIIDIMVQVGDDVQSDHPVVLLEAMKMENEIPAGKSGIVTEIKVSLGQSVSAGEDIVIII
jgi:biotin carboxyl carrier protein